MSSQHPMEANAALPATKNQPAWTDKEMREIALAELRLWTGNSKVQHQPVGLDGVPKGLDS